MIKIFPASKLFSMDIGWLALRDHFISTVGPNSGKGKPLGNLLVAADATLSPQSSFQPHPHRDIEILTWVAEGKMHHQDNLGASGEIPAGTLQLMSSRNGIFHAEGNIQDRPVRLLQIWITPHTKGGSPVYGVTSPTQKGFNLLAAEKDAPLLIRQQAALYVAILNDEESEIEIPSSSLSYGISLGNLQWDHEELNDGDGILLSSGKIKVRGTGQAIIIQQN